MCPRLKRGEGEIIEQRGDLPSDRMAPYHPSAFPGYLIVATMQAEVRG